MACLGVVGPVGADAGQRFVRRYLRQQLGQHERVAHAAVGTSMTRISSAWASMRGGYPNANSECNGCERRKRWTPCRCALHAAVMTMNRGAPAPPRRHKRCRLRAPGVTTCPAGAGCAVLAWGGRLITGGTRRYARVLTQRDDKRKPPEPGSVQCRCASIRAVWLNRCRRRCQCNSVAAAVQDWQRTPVCAAGRYAGRYAAWTIIGQ